MDSNEQKQTELQDQQLIAIIEGALEDMKAKELVTLDVRGRSSVTDYMMVVSGTSKRHVASVAQHALEKLKAAGIQPIGVEGQAVGDWVLVDVGSVILHVMMPDARSFYDIERLWSVASENRSN